MPDPAPRIRFHLDEHMDPDIAVGLRRAGIDVTTTREAGLESQQDVAQLSFAQSQGRVMVTDDRDFLRLASRSSDHSGIVYCRRTLHSTGDILKFLILLHGVSDPVEMRGRVEYPS
jgi:predicted nuclease of predicted toxin-antitoxin system